MPSTVNASIKNKNSLGLRWREHVEKLSSAIEAIPAKLPSSRAKRLGLTTLGAAVVTLKVAVALVVVESSETDDGLIVQPILAVDDERLQDRWTVPVNPPVPLIVTVAVPICPEDRIVRDVGFADTE